MPFTGRACIHRHCNHSFYTNFADTNIIVKQKQVYEVHTQNGFAKHINWFPTQKEFMNDLYENT